MIKAKELKQKALNEGVREIQIEKDYILSWVLQGISKHGQISSCLVFKGGTALKKVYFEDYRFSEDLDFTLIALEISNERLLFWFGEACKYVHDASNISLTVAEIHEHQDGGLYFYIQYSGPLGGSGPKKSIKVDISRNEKLAFAPVLQNVIATYPDLEACQLLCYSLEEVLVEKLRSVMQRMQPRDYYDIWYLMEEHGLQVDFHYPEFCKKCGDKNINATDLQRKLAERIPLYKARWKISMNNQIKNLPDFDKVAREVQKHLKKLPVA